MQIQQLLSETNMIFTRYGIRTVVTHSDNTINNDDVSEVT